MDEEIIINIETTITYETYKKLLFLNIFKGKGYRKKIVFLYILLVWGFITTIVTTGFKLTSLSIIGICVAATYALLTIPKKSYNNAAGKLTKPIRYRFEKQHFSVESSAEDKSVELKINYEGIYKVYETDKALYIYTTSTSACILEKKDFNLETLELLMKFLQSKIGNKYFKE